MTSAAARLGVGVIGAGRVGPVLANALRAVGHGVVGITSTSSDSQERVEVLLPGVPVLDADEVVRRAEVVLVTVPDHEIAPVVAGLAKMGCWQTGQLVVHTSGVHSLDVLEPARAAGAIPLAIHPAMTFTGTSVDVARLQGCPFAVTAPGPVLPIAQALAVELGGEPFVVPPADRATYHAALTHGADHLVTLVSQVTRILVSTGIDEPGRFLAPLLGATLDGALAGAVERPFDDGVPRRIDSDDQPGGPAGQPTGPAVRGDVEMIRAHLEALDELRQPDIAATYRHLAATSVHIAEVRGKLPKSLADELIRLIGSDDL